MEKLYVIKIGGNIIESENLLDLFLQDFSTLNYGKVLVHGGGKNATKFAEELDIKSMFINGRRVTDKKTLRIVDEVYSGLNKDIIIKLFYNGCKAVGYTGKEDSVISATKRGLLDGVDYGYVGDINEVNGDALYEKIQQGYVPVMSPLVYDRETGYKLNTNADTIAYFTAKSLVKYYEVHLVYCFELKGVLENIEDKNSVIPEITPSYYEQLKQKGIISQGMIPKLDNAFEAIHAGVSSVIICKADDMKSIINEGASLGTTIRK
ncbi:MAG: acetylglutamate kinase [Cytophagaceae bacterium]|nr:acetylglutamate kinase [Cytophagaceae bacterium]MDW8455287.1 acetylglutamate kinase [Cytophagaceae bacterium]